MYNKTKHNLNNNFLYFCQYLTTIMTPNSQLACVGAHHQSQCNNCPPRTPAQIFVPHICLATSPVDNRIDRSGRAQADQMCMCMCVRPKPETNAVSAYSSQPFTQYDPYSYNPYFFGKKKR